VASSFKIITSVNGVQTNDTSKKLKKLNPKFHKSIFEEWANEAGESTKKQVLEHISSGISPVKGEGRFKKYSTSYKKAIKAGRYASFDKKLRPVNLKLSGKLLKSLKLTVFKKVFRLAFTATTKSGDNLANIHSIKGAGKAKAIRKMLPQDGEEFSETINRKNVKILKLIIRKFLRKP